MSSAVALVAVGWAAAEAQPATGSHSAYLNAKFADHPVQPSQFGPDSGPADIIKLSNYVVNIHWTSWGGAQATGDAQVRLLTDRTSTSPVTVTVGGLRQCGGKPTYTTYSLALAPGAAQPKYWPQGQTGSFPCHITAGGYDSNNPNGGVFSLGFNPNDPGERQNAARGGCVLPNGVGKPGIGGWRPQLPRGSSFAGLCGMRWTGWGSPVAIGRGIMRNGSEDWGAKVRFDALAWCPGDALSYPVETLTLYGNGEAIPGRGNVSRSEAARLQKDIGRPGVAKHVYRKALAGCS